MRREQKFRTSRVLRDSGCMHMYPDRKSKWDTQTRGSCDVKIAREESFCMHLHVVSEQRRKKLTFESTQCAKKFSEILGLHRRSARHPQELLLLCRHRRTHKAEFSLSCSPQASEVPFDSVLLMIVVVMLHKGFNGATGTQPFTHSRAKTRTLDFPCIDL